MSFRRLLRNDKKIIQNIDNQSFKHSEIRNPHSEIFPDAQPAKGLFVEYDMKTNFAEYHPHLERYVFPALLGLSKEGDFKHFEQIQFIKTPEMKLTYTIELNHTTNDQKIQSLSR